MESLCLWQQPRARQPAPRWASGEEGGSESQEDPGALVGSSACADITPWGWNHSWINWVLLVQLSFCRRLRLGQESCALALGRLVTRREDALVLARVWVQDLSSSADVAKEVPFPCWGSF